MLRHILGLLLVAITAAPAFAASTINTTIPANGTPYNPTPIRQNFGAAAADINALQGMNAGLSAPSAPGLGTLWLNTSTTTYVLNIYVPASHSWLPIARIDSAGGIWEPPIGGGILPSIVSASTTDLGSVPQAALNITGSQSIASFGSSTPAGQLKFLVFTGAPTLIYNATFMILPGAANLTLSASQSLIALSLGGGAWRVGFSAATACGIATTSANGCVHPDGTTITIDGTGLITAAAAGLTSVALSVPSGSLFSVTGSPVTSSGTLGITTAGTSGGIPYFSSGTQLNTSAVLALNQPVLGGGAGGAPTTGTRSGNTTEFGTVSGALTAGHAIVSDASGNLVDGGVVPSTGTVISVALSVPATSIFGVTGSPVTTSGTLGLTTSGTSGGIPYFSSATTLATSALLSANNPVLGGGSGSAPISGAKSGNTNTLATTSGTLTNGHLAAFDVSSNIVDGGVSPTSSGCLNGVAASYVCYSTGSGTTGDTNLTWVAGNHNLKVIGNSGVLGHNYSAQFIGGNADGSHSAAIFGDTTGTADTKYVSIGYDSANSRGLLYTGASEILLINSQGGGVGGGGAVSITCANASGMLTGGLGACGIQDNVSAGITAQAYGLRGGGIRWYLAADNGDGGMLSLATGPNEKVKIYANGLSFFRGSDIHLGLTTALATNATTIFPYMPTMAGAPTGTPGNAVAGQSAFVNDTTNHKICWYEQVNTAWKCALGS